jgi:hypothetical protein
LSPVVCGSLFSSKEKAGFFSYTNSISIRNNLPVIQTIYCTISFFVLSPILINSQSLFSFADIIPYLCNFVGLLKELIDYILTLFCSINDWVREVTFSESSFVSSYFNFGYIIRFAPDAM